MPQYNVPKKRAVRRGERASRSCARLGCLRSSSSAATLLVLPPTAAEAGIITANFHRVSQGRRTVEEHLNIRNVFPVRLVPLRQSLSNHFYYKWRESPQPFGASAHEQRRGGLNYLVRHSYLLPCRGATRRAYLHFTPDIRQAGIPPFSGCKRIRVYQPHRLHLQLRFRVTATPTLR